MPPRVPHRALILLCTWLASTAAARADVVALTNGGEIRGELLSESRPARPAPVIAVRTLTGAVVEVARNDVRAVVRRRPLVEEYETRLRTAPDSVAGQWELAEWCRQKSLTKERLVHLERVVALDPEHLAARRGLGHVREQGTWMTPEQRTAARGLIRHKGKSVTPQELDLIREGDRISAAEKSWLRRVKQWQGWLASDRADRRNEGLARLNEVRDPTALAALARTFRDDPVEEHRLLYVAVLGRIDGEKSIVHLAVQSLTDDSPAVREAALGAIRRKDAARALPVYIAALKNPLNAIVNRAAVALGQLGNDSTIPHLIAALVTRHAYRAIVDDDGPPGMADGPDDPEPVVVGPTSDLTFRGKRGPAIVAKSDPPLVGADEDRAEVELEKDEQNPDVLFALTLLTGQNLGYDAQAWRTWYTTRKSTGGPKRPSPSP